MLRFERHSRFGDDAEESAELERLFGGAHFLHIVQHEFRKLQGHRFSAHPAQLDHVMLTLLPKAAAERTAPLTASVGSTTSGRKEPPVRITSSMRRSSFFESTLFALAASMIACKQAKTASSRS